MSSNTKLTHPWINLTGQRVDPSKKGLWSKNDPYRLSEDINRDVAEVVHGFVVTVTDSPHTEIRVRLDDHGEKLYLALPPSSMPTSALGGGTSSLPQSQQRFVGCKFPDSNYIRIVSYVQLPSDVGSDGLMLQEEPLDPGDMTIVGGGDNSPKITMKGRGKFMINLGTNVKQIFDKASGKIRHIAKQLATSTLGNWVSIDHKPLDMTAPLWAPNSSLYT